MENQGLGLLACDEELFARVWDRVTGDGQRGDAPPLLTPESPAPPKPAPVCTAPDTALVPAATPVDPTGAALQRWVLLLLTDGAAYRALARRTARGRETLAALGREKQLQARSLAAEYFLRTGVRYWPGDSLRPLETLPLFPSLRALWGAERRRETALRAQAAEEEPELANRYLALADASRAAAHRVRDLLEAVW